MPDPSLWGWIAAGATGGAFMWLVRWVLAHMESDLSHARQAGVHGTELAEEGAELAERKVRR
ncbi:MAG TPA: hypothetical protein VM305_07565 [Candidatus Limnocylindrales bacterium]|nr:hypothetical protein [Candidatus Limnocylindrales bacterium]